MHVTAFLKSPKAHETGPVVVLYGPERHLKHEALEAVSSIVLAGEDDRVGLSRYAGKDADLTTIFDELCTVSMWGDRRLVVIDDADEFVSENRSQLEKYLAKPAKKSVLLLIVKSWPKTTRLAKAVAKIGLDLECATLTGNRLLRWLVETAKDSNGKTLRPDAAELLVEFAGADLGLLSQELHKLTSYVGERSQIVADDVRLLVGGWKAETTWAMTGAVRDGNLALALVCLDKLLTAGEAPQKIVGGISYVFRKLAQATELARQGVSLNAALAQSGVFKREIDLWARYLRRIKRPSAEQIYPWLLEIDAGMKGNSRMPERLQLEQLLLKLSGSTHKRQ
jgi:DNA polymerase-3 subunit delta